MFRDTPKIGGNASGYFVFVSGGVRWGLPGTLVFSAFLFPVCHMAKRHTSMAKNLIPYVPTACRHTGLFGFLISSVPNGKTAH